MQGLEWVLQMYTTGSVQDYRCDRVPGLCTQGHMMYQGHVCT